MTLCFLIANSGEVSHLVKLVCTFLAVVNGIVSYGLERRLLMRVYRLEGLERVLERVIKEKYKEMRQENE